jgi:hypothetical protein
VIKSGVEDKLETSSFARDSRRDQRKIKLDHDLGSQSDREVGSNQLVSESSRTMIRLDLQEIKGNWKHAGEESFTRNSESGLKEDQTRSRSDHDRTQRVR